MLAGLLGTAREVVSQVPRLTLAMLILSLGSGMSNAATRGPASVEQTRKMLRQEERLAPPATRPRAGSAPTGLRGRRPSWSRRRRRPAGTAT
jgi:hypothetical protein